MFFLTSHQFLLLAFLINLLIALRFPFDSDSLPCFFEMVGMKTCLKSCTSKSRQPPIRQACPTVDLEELKEKLHAYVIKVGVKESFNLYSYNNLPATHAADGYSLLKKEQLLMVLLQISPTGMIKWSVLRDACKYLESTFGEDVFPSFNHLAKALVPGKVADQVFVLLAHIRRVMGQDSRWNETFSRFNGTELQGMQNIRDFMEEQGFVIKHSGSSSSSASDASTEAVRTPEKYRRLSFQISDVSVDSVGLPKVPHAKVSDAKAPRPQVSPVKLEEDVKALCEDSPLPLKKKPAAAIVMKRPATMKKQVAAVAMKNHCTGNFRINKATLLVAGGCNQSYIQHVPLQGGKKQLVVAVSKAMNHEHKKLAAKIHQWMLKQPQPLFKQTVVDYRNKLLA